MRSQTHIDLASFWSDPYPALAEMRENAPLTFVPELGAWLMTRRDDIFENEKKVAVYSSVQPGGLMTRLMGQNMMRKDGEDHARERRAMFPAVSPRTVRDVWKAAFAASCAGVLGALVPRGACDLVRDFALPVSADALRVMTGLTNMERGEMDRVSQGMIDGCANYAGDPAVEAHCHDCTASIDAHIDAMMPVLRNSPDQSILSVLMEAGQPEDSIRANVKLAISGGQNEPRDAIAGTAWALLTHPDELARIRAGACSYADAFEEYARWMSPIGMSPREVTRNHSLLGQELIKGDRLFLMFGAGNRDPRNFANPDAFDTDRDNADAISFGAGPHFCAGAWAARTLIGEVALPMLFDRLPCLQLVPGAPARFGGWAFRGPLEVQVQW